MQPCRDAGASELDRRRRSLPWMSYAPRTTDRASASAAEAPQTAAYRGQDTKPRRAVRCRTCGAPRLGVPSTDHRQQVDGSRPVEPDESRAVAHGRPPRPRRLPRAACAWRDPQPPCRPHAARKSAMAATSLLSDVLVARAPRRIPGLRPRPFNFRRGSATTWPMIVKAILSTLIASDARGRARDGAGQGYAQSAAAARARPSGRSQDAGQAAVRRAHHAGEIGHRT